MVSAIFTPLMLLALCGVRCVEAKPEFVSRVPNGDKVAGVQALGHVDPSGGGALSVFGEAFKTAGLEWTVELCLADSDGDGQTNGEELGDPCCVWHPAAGPNPADVPTFSANVSNPSDAKDLVATAILEQWVCGYQPSSSSSSSSGLKESQGATGSGANPSTKGSGSGSSFSAGIKSNFTVPNPSTKTSSATGARGGVGAALAGVVGVCGIAAVEIRRA